MIKVHYFLFFWGDCSKRIDFTGPVGTRAEILRYLLVHVARLDDLLEFGTVRVGQFTAPGLLDLKSKILFNSF